MSREINSTQPYTDKLVKLIPTEIIGAYMVLAGVLGFAPATTFAPAAESGGIVRIADADLERMLIQVVFAVLLVLTPLYAWRINKVHNRVQLGVITLSFVVWVYTLGGPFVVWDVYYPLVASVVLVLWSLTIPLVVPAKEDASLSVPAGRVTSPTA